MAFNLLAIQDVSHSCEEGLRLPPLAASLWCMDSKGYFSTGDGTRWDPFTITDALLRMNPISAATSIASTGDLSRFLASRPMLL